MSQGESRFGEWLLKGMLTAIFMGIVGWISYLSLRADDTASKPDRAEVEKMIETNSPYVRDRGTIQTHLNHMQRDMEHLKHTVEKVDDKMDDVRDAVHVLVGRQSGENVSKK